MIHISITRKNKAAILFDEMKTKQNPLYNRRRRKKKKRKILTQKDLPTTILTLESTEPSGALQYIISVVSYSSQLFQTLSANTAAAKANFLIVILLDHSLSKTEQKTSRQKRRKEEENSKLKEEAPDSRLLHTYIRYTACKSSSFLLSKISLCRK